MKTIRAQRDEWRKEIAGYRPRTGAWPLQDVLRLLDDADLAEEAIALLRKLTWKGRRVSAALCTELERK